MKTTKSVEGRELLRRGGGQDPVLPFVPEQMLKELHEPYVRRAAPVEDDVWRVRYAEFEAALRDRDTVRGQHADLFLKRGGCCNPRVLWRRRAVHRYYAVQNDLIEAIEPAFGEKYDDSVEEMVETAEEFRNEPRDAAAEGGGSEAARGADAPTAESDIEAPPAPPVESALALDDITSADDTSTAAAREVAKGAAKDAPKDAAVDALVPKASCAEQCDRSARGGAASFRNPVEVMVNLSFAANVFLLVIKLVAAFWSGSLSVIASTIDSFLDLFSGSILFIATCLAKRSDTIKFPVGRTRLEPLGVLIFSAVRGAPRDRR